MTWRNMSGVDGLAKQSHATHDLPRRLGKPYTEKGAPGGKLGGMVFLSLGNFSTRSTCKKPTTNLWVMWLSTTLAQYFVLNTGQCACAIQTAMSRLVGKWSNQAIAAVIVAIATTATNTGRRKQRKRCSKLSKRNYKAMQLTNQVPACRNETGNAL
jgi:hypothetical protein